jgi:hypothetical protein
MRARPKLAERRKFMSDEDRYTVAEFARRYKIAGANLEAFCARFDLLPETVMTREGFKRMLDDYQEDSSPAEEATNEGSAPELEKERPEEEDLNQSKRTFERWVKEKKIRHPVYLKVTAGYESDTLLTEQEFDRAVDKYLYNKES